MQVPPSSRLASPSVATRNSLPVPSNPTSPLNAKGSKYRKLLGNEFDEKMLADPITLLRQQTLKHGYSIPDDLAKESAKSADPVVALNAYRKLPDINAIDPLLTQMFALEMKSPDAGKQINKDNRVSKATSPVSPLPSKSMMLKNRNSNSGSLFQRISSFRADRTQTISLASEETKSMDSADGVSTDESLSPAQGKLGTVNELKVEAIAGHSLGAPLVKSRIDIVVDLENIISTSSSDLDCYFSLFDANKDEFIS
jgi:hypothetical protein